MSGKTARHIRSFPPEAEHRCARSSTALVDRAAPSALDGRVFFDRGLIDAAANLQFMTGEPVLATLGHLTVTIGECF
jgi:predicted ATPase